MLKKQEATNKNKVKTKPNQNNMYLTFRNVKLIVL